MLRKFSVYFCYTFRFVAADILENNPLAQMKEAECTVADVASPIMTSQIISIKTVIKGLKYTRK